MGESNVEKIRVSDGVEPITEHYNEFRKEYKNQPEWNKLTDNIKYFWIYRGEEYGWVYPHCCHCDQGACDLKEIAERGYTCDYCGKYICRNCSWEILEYHGQNTELEVRWF